jgi:pilus assembly protein Flp/PilA
MSAGEGRHKPPAGRWGRAARACSLDNGVNLFFFYTDLLTASSTVQLTTCGSFGRKEAMKVLVSRFISDEAGATAIEYGLLAALISVVIIGAVKLAGSNLSTTFTNVANNLS